jgi:hypothetical protein
VAVAQKEEKVVVVCGGGGGSNIGSIILGFVHEG